MREKIISKIKENLKPESLEVIDESHLHAGHNEYTGSEESHFRIKISSENLKDLSRVAAHRKINKLLGEELKTIHALAIEIN